MTFLRFGRCVLATLLVLMLATAGPVKADVQPVPTVGRQITITDTGVAGTCFDSLQNLKLSEKYLDTWSDDKMNAFLGAHSLIFYDGGKARVLVVLPTYTWKDSVQGSTDYVKPIQLLIESPYHNPVGTGRSNWQGHTCWWEFSQNPDMLLKFTWWK
jgi:hypothetical protein